MHFPACRHAVVQVQLQLVPDGAHIRLVHFYLIPEEICQLGALGI